MINKPRNNGAWTEARYHSFVKGALRSASVRWPPKHRVKRAAWIKRGIYKCAGYKRRAHQVPVSVEKNDKRINNLFIDHLCPVIDPVVGFVSWDILIERLFVEAEGLQVLCMECHKAKTADERKFSAIT